MPAILKMNILMDRGDTVQSVQRALRVIERLSRQPVVSLARLHSSTGLPKATLSRLLGTLIAEGYVRRVSHAEGYALTSKVLHLSAAIRQSDRLVELALPLMEAFTQSINGRSDWQPARVTPCVSAPPPRASAPMVSVGTG